MQIEFTVPTWDKTTFTCPYCNIFAEHITYSVALQPSGKFNSRFQGKRMAENQLTIKECFSCEKLTIWYNQKMIWPHAFPVDPPNPDMDSGVKAIYEEASRIAGLSPRAAAALLRLGIDKLCAQIGVKGKDLNEKIGNLVADGLHPKIQQALDCVRVIGNNAVHPGQIDFEDNPTIVNQLFSLMNIITTQIITEEKEIDKVFNSLPPSTLQQIQERDGKTSSP